KDAFPMALGLVANRGQIGDDAHIPEQQRDSEVGADGKDVPDQGTAELRPERHRIRIRQEEIKNPWPAQMEQRKKTGAHYREESHGFGEPVNGRAPFLEQEQQDSGDKSAGVTDPDPPNEVRDGKAPRYWNVDPPNTDPSIEQIGNGR